jgi:hypothetical protein
MHTARKLRGLRLATGALLITTAAAGAAHVAFADTSNPSSVHPDQAATSAAGPGGTTENAFRAAVEALVTRGVINQSQADAVQRQVLAGSVDPEALVAGTLSNDQMRQVAESLRAVKWAAGGNRGTPPDLSTTPMKKPPPPRAG